MRGTGTLLLLLAGLGAAPAPLADGLYAEIRTVRGLIRIRLEPGRTPLTVANFVGLAEGTIGNQAFGAGWPFFDGTRFHRVVPGHVIQAGIPAVEHAQGPGYTIPNEVDASLSHDHAGAVGMANRGPHTNNSQFYITLGDRGYLDGDYTVFGEVVAGLDAVQAIRQGDVLESVRIRRVGPAAADYRVTEESFRELLEAARQRVSEQEQDKRRVEQQWIGSVYPDVRGGADAVLRKTIEAPGDGAAAATLFLYRLRVLRTLGHIAGRSGPPVEVLDLVSGEDGTPHREPVAAAFRWESGRTKICPGLDAELAAMRRGEKRLVIVPAALGYGDAGFYRPARRTVIPPRAVLVYEIEALNTPPALP